MKENEHATDVFISEQEVQAFAQRGYNADLLPKGKDKRTMSTFNYFTLWMGSVHNVPNYLTVGSFLALGLSPINVMLALIISGFSIAVFMSLNGRAGSKYGIPFALHLRSAYGRTGAKLPGFLRGCVAAIAWFGIQNITGSIALLIVLERLIPGFNAIGGSTNILGLSIPGLISFSIFTGINILIGFGGGSILSKFTAVLNPLIYLVFGGMTIWAIGVAGGLDKIFHYVVPVDSNQVQPAWIGFLVVINSCIAVWAAPGASASDFTQNAKSTRAQTLGQIASLVVAYGIFAISSVSILIGSSIQSGQIQWNILEIIKTWDNLPAVILAVTVLLMTTISTNATGNIIPAGYQLAALFPKKIDYKKGVLIASFVSVVIMPWKLIENQDSVFMFLNLIGSMLGPVAGVMLADYYMIKKQKIDLNELYMELDGKVDTNNPYVGINVQAYIATFIGLGVTLLATYTQALAFISNISWFVGVGLAFVVYVLLKGKKD